MDAVEGKRYEVVSKLVPIRPGMVIEEAEKGCIPSTLAVLIAIKTQQLPSTYNTDALKMFTAHLTNMHPSKKQSLTNIRLADCAFAGTSILCALFLRDKPLDMSVILRNWTSLVDWARVLIIDKAGGQRPFLQPLRVRIQSLLTILDAVHLLQAEEPFRRSLMEPRLLELVMHVWLINGSDVAPRDKMSCLAIVTLYLAENNVEKKALDYLQTISRNKDAQVVGVILSLISVASHEVPPDLVTIGKCVDLLGKLAFESDRPLSLAVWRDGASTVSTAMTRISEFYPSFQRDPIFGEVWGLCFAVLSGSMMMSTGSSWLLQSFQDGLLYNTAVCSPAFSIFSPVFVKAVGTMFSGLLPLYLVNPSIISAIEVDLANITGDLRKQVIGSAISSAWKTFIRYFFERFVFACYYEAVESTRKCYKCGTSLDDSAGRGSLNRPSCSSCGVAEYCSTKCQNTDWKVHKKDCSQMRDGKWVLQPPWKIRHFRNKLAIHDARRHLPGIHELAARKHPGIALDDLAISLDYSRFPPKLDVLLISEMMSKSGELSSPSLRMLGEKCLNEMRASHGILGFLKFLAYEGKGASALYQTFEWTTPSFCSTSGSSQRSEDAGRHSTHSTTFLGPEGEPVEATWDVVDELMLRCGVSADEILKGTSNNVKEIREKVVRAVNHEKARNLRIGRGTVVYTG